MKKAKKFLIFSLAYYPLHVGGAEVAIKEITDRVDTKDIEFDLVCLRFDSSLQKSEKIGNVNVHRVGFTMNNPTMSDLVKFPMYLNKVFFPVFAFFKAVSLHRKRNYDVLWSMMSYMGFPALFFKLFYKKDIPFLLTLQEGDSISHITKRWRIRIFGILYKMIFRRADFVQVISTYLGGFARDMGYVGAIEVVPNAVNVAHFSREYTQSELDELKQQLGKKEDDKFIITTSRLVHKNAVDDVMSALEYLPENVKFLILGIGPDEEKLKRLVKEKDVGERVIFVGQVGHIELPKYLRVSDVFTRPSRSEGFGNSFIEAMVTGIPVVATSEGGISDFLVDVFDARAEGARATGFVVKTNNPKDLAGKIETALAGGEVVENVVLNAKEMVYKKYDWNIIASDMKTKVFDKVSK